MSSQTSSRNGRTQVMIVGAGPVGLLATLRLCRSGIDVRIVDQQSEQDARSFPIVLHPQSLRLLSDLSAVPALAWRSRPVQRLAIYTEYERRAVLDLPGATDCAKGAVTLPQDILRLALLRELSELGVEVEWNTRLSVLQQDERRVWGRLLHRVPDSQAPALGGEGGTFEADFLIGADGYESSVRSALGIRLVQLGNVQIFAFFDAATQHAGNEAQLAISDECCSSVYALQGGQSRFSFQLRRSLHRTPDERALLDLQRARLPWLGDRIVSCDWCGVAEFRNALVETFGRGRVWLAGESAHLTGPLGAQSLNIGLDEADELARRITEALAQPYAASIGPDYGVKRRQQWSALLGIGQSVAGGAAPDWARRHHERLIPCLPASGADLIDLLGQIWFSRGASTPAQRA